MGGAPARPSPPGVGFECKACRGQDDHQQHDVYEVVGMDNDDQYYDNDDDLADNVDSVDLPPLVAHDDHQQDNHHEVVTIDDDDYDCNHK